MKHHHCKCHSRDNEDSFIPGLVLGAFIGAAAAMLLTPKDGKSNREILKRKSKKAKNYINDNIKPLVEQLGADIKEEIEKRTKQEDSL